MSKNKNKKKNKHPRSGQAAPSYRLFGNAVLNDIFCYSEEASVDFCQLAYDRFMECVVKLFDPTLPPDDKEQLSKMRHRVVAHICAHIECAFELGWNEAMRRASKVMLEDLL